MNSSETRPRMILNLFDEGGAGAPAGGGEAAESAAAETKALPSTSRRAKAGDAYKNVVFGKTEGGEGSDAGSQKQEKQEKQEKTTEAPAKSLDDLRREYDDFKSRADMKKFFVDDTQRVIDRRFKETKELEARLGGYEPILDVLRTRYGTDDAAKIAEAITHDDELLEEAASAAGMSTQQYREFETLKRQHARMEAAKQQAEEARARAAMVQARRTEAAALKEKYPAFDYSAEAKDPQFLAMLKAGVGMKAAYEALHHGELLAGAVQQASQRTEKAVTDNVRARGSRPLEAGAGGAKGGVVVKNDAKALSRADRAEIARRAAKGDTIVF